MKSRKTVQYTNEISDDFAGTNIQTKTVGDSFRYCGQTPLWHAVGAILYRLVATPVAWTVCHVCFRVRVENRKALRALRGKGYFLYANHTQALHDAFEPSLVSFPKKCHIITSADAVSIPFLRNLVLMFGALPLPGTIRACRNFRAALDNAILQKRAVMIYPEAHIWPYYTGVRNFPDDSFAYPVRLNAPVVAMAVKYRERRIFRNRHPFITVVLSDPIYPDKSLSPAEARKELRNTVYHFLQKTLCVPDNAEYIHYEKVDELSDITDEEGYEWENAGDAV